MQQLRWEAEHGETAISMHTDETDHLTFVYTVKEETETGGTPKKPNNNKKEKKRKTMTAMAVYRHSIKEEEREEEDMPTREIHVEVDKSKCGALWQLVPLSHELLAMVFRNGYVTIQRTHQAQKTQTQIAVTKDIVSVKFCCAVSETTLLLLVKRNRDSEHRIILVDAADKRQEQQKQQERVENVKLMMPSEANSHMVALDEKNQTVEACCYNAKARVFTVIYSTGFVMEANITGGKDNVKQQILQRRLDLSSLGESIHAASAGDHIVLLDTSSEQSKLHLWSTGFTCLLEEPEELTVNEDVRQVVLKEEQGQDDGTVMILTDHAVLAKDIVLHKLNLAMMIERQTQTRQFLTDKSESSASSSPAAVAEERPAISFMLTADNINTMLCTDWNQFVKTKMKNANQQRYELLNDDISDGDLFEKINSKQSRSEDSIFKLTQFVTELAVRCLREKKMKSLQRCITTGRVRMVQLVRMMCLESVLEILYDVDNLSLLEEILHRVSDLSPQHLIQIMQWLLHETNEEKLQKSLHGTFARSNGNAVEYFLSLALATVSKFDDIILTKHASSLSMDEVTAIFKLLSKQIRQQWGLTDTKRRQLCAYMPSMEVLLLWVQILINAHFANVLMNERVLIYLQQIRNVVAKEMDIIHGISTLPSQVNMLLKVRNVESGKDAGAIRTKLPTRRSGDELDYEIQMRHVRF